DSGQGHLACSHRLTQAAGHALGLTEGREQRHLEATTPCLLGESLGDLYLANVFIGASPGNEYPAVRLHDEGVAHHVIESLGQRDGLFEVLRGLARADALPPAEVQQLTARHEPSRPCLTIPIVRFEQASRLGPVPDGSRRVPQADPLRCLCGRSSSVAEIPSSLLVEGEQASELIEPVVVQRSERPRYRSVQTP